MLSATRVPYKYGTCSIRSCARGVRSQEQCFSNPFFFFFFSAHKQTVIDLKGCWTHGRTHGQTHTLFTVGRTVGHIVGHTVHNHVSAHKRWWIQRVIGSITQQDTWTHTHCSAGHMDTYTLFSRTHGQTHCSQPHPLTFGSGNKLWWSNARALGKPCHPHCIRHNNSAASTGAKLGVNNTRDLQVIHTKKGKERKPICGTVRTSTQNQSVRTRTDEDDSDFNTRTLQVMKLLSCLKMTVVLTLATCK
jgi:hypothetical protein